MDDFLGIVIGTLVILFVIFCIIETLKEEAQKKGKKPLPARIIESCKETGQILDATNAMITLTNLNAQKQAFYLDQLFLVAREATQTDQKALAFLAKLPLNDFNILLAKIFFEHGEAPYLKSERWCNSKPSLKDEFDDTLLFATLAQIAKRNPDKDLAYEIKTATQHMLTTQAAIQHLF